MAPDGTPRLQRWTVTQPEQLQMLWPGARFEQIGRDDFSAQVSRRTLVTLTIEGISATPYAVRRDDDAVERVPRDGLLVHVVCEGHGLVRRRDEQFDVQAGSVFLLRPSEPFEYRCPVMTRTFRATIAETLLPPPLRTIFSPRFRALPPSTVTAAFSRLAHDLLHPDGELGRSRVTDAHLDAAITALQQGILAEEVVESEQPGTGSAALRQQVLDQIELQLRDPELGPRTLAEHFSVSLRTLHKLFEALPETVADRIRRRRVEEAAAVLRVRDATAGELAEAFGFRSRDTFQRAFARQIGVSPNAYRVLEKRPAH